LTLLTIQVLDRLTKIIAPVVPHLAEEIHATTTKLETSVFADEWTPQVRL
jgi:isoleucyl-tRNA synthetase